jgi:hypothetical protein
MERPSVRSAIAAEAEDPGNDYSATRSCSPTPTILYAHGALWHDYLRAALSALAPGRFSCRARLMHVYRARTALSFRAGGSRLRKACAHALFVANLFDRKAGVRGDDFDQAVSRIAR